MPFQNQNGSAPPVLEAQWKSVVYIHMDSFHERLIPRAIEEDGGKGRPTQTPRRLDPMRSVNDEPLVAPKDDWRPRALRLHQQAEVLLAQTATPNTLEDFKIGDGHTLHLIAHAR